MIYMMVSLFTGKIFALKTLQEQGTNKHTMHQTYYLLICLSFLIFSLNSYSSFVVPLFIYLFIWLTSILKDAVMKKKHKHDFTNVVKWLGQRANVVLLFFDPDKPGTTGETLRILTQVLGESSWDWTWSTYGGR